MSLTSRLTSRWMHLPPAKTHAVAVIRNIPVPMPDGVILLADHYTPRNSIRLPTILIRSPYGRTAFSARSYAERGFRVIVQSVVALQALEVISGLCVINAKTAWQPLRGSSNRNGFQVNLLWLAQATLALCSGL